MKRVQNIVQFCKMHGFSTDYDVLGHIHAGLRSAPQTKTYQRWNEKTLAGLKASRDAGIKAYRLAVERGMWSRRPSKLWKSSQRTQKRSAAKPPQGSSKSVRPAERFSQVAT